MNHRSLIGRVVVPAAIVLWLVAVVAGMARIWAYALAPGTAGFAPEHWPAASRITAPSDRETLLLFAHPRCPCTRATVDELSRLVAQSEGRVAVRVLFVRPGESDDAWVRTDLWRSAAAIPGVDVIVDPDGAEARRFGAATSGQTLLYGTDGRLLFRGGITAARGHSGDNLGRSAIVAIADDRAPGVRETSVFGCELFAPDGACTQGMEQCAR